MKRLAIILAAAFWLGACNGPPPPEPCEAPPDCEDWDAELCECRDEEPPPPCEPPPDCEEWDATACECLDVPPPGPDPGDYVNLDRVEDIINGTAGQTGLLTGLPWAGWRDPLNVATNCPSEVEYIGFANEFELGDFGVFGMELTREGEDFIVPQLRKVNRRCKENHPEHDPRFCGRSEMRKSRLLEYRGTEEEPRLDAHMEKANAARTLAGRCRAKLQANGGSAFDSIAGWCQSMNIAGFSKEDCPQ